jgi:hypothetical protein
VLGFLWDALVFVWDWVLWPLLTLADLPTWLDS